MDKTLKKIAIVLCSITGFLFLILILVFSIAGEDYFKPNIACDLLMTDGFMTNGYNSDGSDYFCTSPYYKLDDLTTITYSATGTKEKVNKLNLDLNYNKNTEKNYSHNEFLKIAEKLYSQIDDQKLPDKIKNAIINAEEENIQTGNYTISLNKDNYNNDLGYHLNFCIEKNKNEKNTD